jgi:hypothetical protein
MVDLYKNALDRQASAGQTNIVAETSDEKQLKNVKHQDIVRLYDIIIQVIKKLIL